MKAVLLSLFTVFAATQAQAQMRVFAIGDVAVLQQAADGTYDVICTNGNREKATDMDIRVGNVCPNLTSTEPTNILSLQLRDDGAFNVVCKDMTRLTATAAEVMSGAVCATAVPVPVPAPTPEPVPQPQPAPVPQPAPAPAP